MTNCHTRRNSMRIDNQIGNNTFSCEWKIFLPIGHTTCTFLSMTRCKLISDLRSFDRSCLNFNKKVIGGIIFGKHNLINFTCFRMSNSLRGILEHFLGNVSGTINILFLLRLNNFSNNNIITTDLSSRTDETIMIKFIVLSMCKTSSVLNIELPDLLSF